MKSKAQELERKLIQIFSKEPEVWKIQVFGRLIEGIADEYSDVDIRIISKDPYLTQKKLHELITINISPIRQAFPFFSNENLFVEMIMLEAYSPYQKIDISIERDGFGFEFEPIATVFQNDLAVGQDRDCDIFEIKKTASYDLSNMLFGIPRTTKCFFRKDFDMYRRWKSQTDALLVILNEKYLGWQASDLKDKIRAHDAKVLYKMLSEDEASKLKKIFPLDGILTLPESFLTMLDMYIDIVKQKAKDLGESLDENFISYMEKFASSEVRRAKK